MPFSRALAAAVVASLALTGCGDESSTVTTSGAGVDRPTTTGAAIGAGSSDPGTELGDTGFTNPITETTGAGTGSGEGDPDVAPSDDGGALCAALEPWLASQNDITPVPSAAEAGRMLLVSAESFDRDVMPVVPTAVVGDAEALMAAYRAAGDALLAYPAPDTPAAQLNLPELTALVAISQPQGRVSNSLDTDESTSAMYYPNLLIAWMDDPCGPKALRTEVDEQFTSIVNNI